MSTLIQEPDKLTLTFLEAEPFPVEFLFTLGRVGVATVLLSAGNFVETAGFDFSLELLLEAGDLEELATDFEFFGLSSILDC